MTTKLFLLSAVAEMTGLSKRALADAARAGKMPTFKIHGRRYMSEEQIETYIAAREGGSKMPAAAEPSEDEAWAKFEAARKRRQSRSARKSDTR